MKLYRHRLQGDCVLDETQVLIPSGILRYDRDKIVRRNGKVVHVH